MPPTPCRLLIDPPAAGAWNMAVDEVLLEWSGRTGTCGLRFYAWDEPTLSLGYFQAYDDRAGHAASRACPVVRRATGGGAILHDRELTYSLVVPRAHPLGAERVALYRAVHDALVALLARGGVAARLCQSPREPDGRREPFLCFQRRSPGDVVAGGFKIAGSAQRRSRDAVLQHGSVLLDRSPAAPEIEAPTEMAQVAADPAGLIEVWLPHLAAGLGVEWHRGPLSHSERDQAEALVRTKYGCEDWTRNRGRGEPKPHRVT